MASKTLAIILGAGPGTGQAIATAFAARHSVALLARNKDSLQAVRDEVVKSGGDAHAFTCDASSSDSIDAAFTAIKQQFPDHKITTGIFNANSPFIVKPFLELKKEDVDPGVNINFYGAFFFSQKLIPLLLASGTPSFLAFTGATAALKGSAKFAALAPSKFALRGLSQSLAREFGPQGIHVAHLVVDGLINTAAVEKFTGGKREKDSLIEPAAIASTLLHLSEQPPSCWTQELEIRPSVEKW